MKKEKNSQADFERKRRNLTGGNPVQYTQLDPWRETVSSGHLIKVRSLFASKSTSRQAGLLLLG